MKQFKTIFAHEFCEHIKQKSFLVVTIIFVVAIAVVMFFPRITGSGDDSESGSSSSERSKIGLFTSAEVDAALAKRAFEQGEYYSEYEIVAVDSEEALKKGVTDKTYKYGYAVFSTSEYKFYINDLSISDDSRSESDEAIKRLNYATVMKAGGIPEADIEAAGSMQITGNIEVLGSDQASNYFYAYFMIFALYMIILLYGQMVAMG
ncbi:MAG: hypothetical protein J6P16_04520, partial [Eubacterium sp.]|nr:hypothetical protein [Eubacterium sp.]